MAVWVGNALGGRGLGAAPVPAPADPHVLTKAALDAIAGGPAQNRGSLPIAVFLSDGTLGPFQPLDLARSRYATSAPPLGPAMLAAELTRGRYRMLGEIDNETRGATQKWGRSVMLDAASQLMDIWARDLGKRSDPTAKALRAEVIFARDMFAEMRDTIRAVYSGRRAETEEHAAKAQAYLSDAYAQLEEYGAEVIGAVGAAVAAGSMTISGGATLAASAIGLSAGTLGIGAAAVLVGLIVYSITTAESTGGRKAVVEFFRSEGRRFTPADFDSYLHQISRAVARYHAGYRLPAPTTMTTTAQNRPVKNQEGAPGATPVVVAGVGGALLLWWLLA